ncbi:2-hydroxymuconate tautomerase [Herbiconiux sp. KACC 21604]|uniref:2-hydroxymuconate tautomerase n=1 Tax=unclassified Herbiconiux TaxID=2618217 RepID=UPI001490EDD5|nr:2-hydroxymuconate tautomerase [Herbiconiux sp. SALV-R1]QJU55312.1 2-hydroxymuconate tautomerase family protein [Herbiconiux sp. SALV-R1]WPO86480.1 2-hydroxymuconate tautomerase [Herbiconiux sp. KACC 21604]
MPIIQVSLVQGRTPEQLRALIHGLTKTASETIGAPVETVRVVITEVPPTHWGSGHQTIAEKRGDGSA